MNTTPKNYLVVGASSGIGAQVAQQLSEDATSHVFGTYFRSTLEATNQHISFNYLNVLDDVLDFSFLPETIDGLVYCPLAPST